MAEEDVISEPEVQQEPEQGPGPGPSLSDPDKAKLAGIIKRMQDAKEPDDNIKAVVKTFTEKYSQQPKSTIPKVDYSQVPRPENIGETAHTNVQQLKTEQGVQQSVDPAIVARRKQYDALKNQAITDIEGEDWKNAIFKGKKPALTEGHLPEESYQQMDTKALEDYLDTKDLDMKDRYWLRNQIINYSKQRQAQGAIDANMQENIKDIPEVKAAQDKANEAVIHGLIKPEQYDATWKADVANNPALEHQLTNAYAKSAQQQEIAHTTAIANKLNNVGLDDKPISQNAPFHDQVTGLNKTLMGVLNFSGDIGQQMSSLLEMGNIPGLSEMGYTLKTNADNLKSRNVIPQTGHPLQEMGNYLSGEIVPMALDMEALRRLSGAAGKPIYQALGKARQAGQLGQFMEGAVGGLAISPANSYIIAHQYYNELVKNGANPDEAASKSDQLLLKNMATDLFMTPLQMGLMKMGGGWKTKVLEAPVSGAHFTVQDFNQKSAENPALSIVNYIQNDPDAGKTFMQGAALGLMQKAATDAMHNWEIKTETRKIYDFGRQYGADKRTSLPTNYSIANNVLGSLEMKDTHGRPQELKDLVSAMQQSGTYTPEEAARISNIIDDVAAVRKQVPKYGTPFQKLAVMNELLRQRSMSRYEDNSGHDAAAAPITMDRKISDERIQRIMENKEPLYFFNGNETTKEVLSEMLEKDPNLLSKPGARIDIKNDSEFMNKLKSKSDAVQEQEPGANDVRDASADSPTVGNRTEKEGAINKGASGKEEEHVLEARHSITDHDEQGVVSGQNDRPLSDEGVTKAHDLAEEVNANHNIKKIVSSDLARASETAHIVSNGNIPVEERPELRSWDLKDFGGMKDEEFKEIQKWFADNPDEKVYKGPIESAKGKGLGESLNEYATRVIAARQAVEKEGPGTFLVNHSNNMMIWDAFKANGDVWDADAIKDYMDSPTPEPAKIKGAVEAGPENVTPEEGRQVSDDIKSGKITDDQLKTGAKLFIEYEEGDKEPVPGLPAGDQQEAGGTGTDEAPRQYAKAARAPQLVSASGGQIPSGQNQGGQPVSGSTSTPDPVRLMKAARQLIVAGRTDDQVLAYLQRKGLDPQQSFVALGEAKANPINEKVKIASLDDAMKKYFPKEDLWLGEKELNKVNAQVSTREYQKAIKESIKTDTLQKGFTWKDVDKAIHIYLDTQANPTHFAQYYPTLSPEQKRIADLSQKLNSDQIRVADAIKEEYEHIGQWAKENGVIQDVIDNYVARAWEFKGKPATEENFKFATSTRHSMQRTLETILQGYAEGMKLKVEGATNNFLILKREIGNVIENKKLLDEGLSLRYDSGERGTNGKSIMKPLFTTKTDEPGYVRVESKGFRKWDYDRKLEDYTAEQRKFFGRDTMVTENGTVLQKRDIYAPEEIAKSLNNIMGKGKQSSNFFKDLQVFNAAVKQSILSLSPFHYIAFSRAHGLSAIFKRGGDVSPIMAYRKGLTMLEDQNVHGQELIRNGMTINRQPEWEEGVLDHQTYLGKQLDKMKFTRVMKDKMLNFNEQLHRHLFGTYGAGLKMFDGVQLAQSELIKNPNQQPSEVYARVAKLMNDSYGGINWDRMRGTRMQNPTNRRAMSLLLLAPDWTASNLRMAKKAFEKGDEGLLYRKAWGRVMLRGIAITGLANSILAMMDEQDDDGNPISWAEAMERRYSKAWETGKLRSAMIDITPLYHMVGGPAEKRAYFSVFGAYTDPIKMTTNAGGFIDSKGSYISKGVKDFFTAQNWQGKEFTSLDELLGMDDKGPYMKSTVGHEKGDINQNTGEPYKKAQTEHEAGEDKGGKLAGELLKWPQGGSHPVRTGTPTSGFRDSQLPSFILNEVRGLLPGPVVNIWQMAAGENDVANGMANILGTGIVTNKEPQKKDE